jgi:hypothetical protein
MSPRLPTMADFRAAIAYQNRKRYEVAAEVGAHPTPFGKMLNGKMAMPPRIYAATCTVLQIIPRTDAA